MGPTQQLMMAGQMAHMGGLTKLTKDNLQLWPFTVDPALDKADCEVDFGSQCEHHIQLNSMSQGIVKDGYICGICKETFKGQSITYKWTDQKKKPGWKPDEYYVHRMIELSKAVELAVGPTFRLTIELNGTVIYPLGDTNWEMTKQKSWLQRGWQSLKLMLFKSS